MSEHNFFKTQIKKASSQSTVRRILFTLFIIALLVILSAKPYNLFVKSREVNSIPEIEESFLNKEYNVTVTLEYMELWYTMSSGNSVKNQYYFGYIGDEYVCVRTGKKGFENYNSINVDSYNNITFKGYLSRPSDDDKEATQRFISELKSGYSISEAEARALLSPYIITTDFTRLTSMLIPIAGYILIIIALGGVLKNISISSNYKKSKAYTRLGATEDERERMCTEICNEIDRGDFIINDKQMKITRNWIVQLKGKDIVAQRVPDLIWGYGNVTTHRTNGIKTGTTYQNVLNFRDGTIINMQAKNENAMRENINIFLNLNPQMLPVFTPELKALFDKDRQQFIEVARRTVEQQMAQQAPSFDPQ